MSEIAKIIKLYNHIERQHRCAKSIAGLCDELEVSRATVKRYLDVLRDQLNVPIRYDRDDGYRIGQSKIGPRNQIPGLWLSHREAYAMLALTNALLELDPRTFKKFVLPMRERFLKVLNKDAKDPPDELKIAFSSLIKHNFDVSEALVLGKRLQLDIRMRDGAVSRSEFEPQVLRLGNRSQDWILDAIRLDTGRSQAIRMTDIKSAKLI